MEEKQFCVGRGSPERKGPKLERVPQASRFFLNASMLRENKIEYQINIMNYILHPFLL